MPLRSLCRAHAARHIVLLAAVLISGSLPAFGQGLPAVPVPAENPITEEKRILGKLLFWEQQLSSDDTIACGSCHAPSFAGGDGRIDVHPGPDETFDTDDDVFASPGVVRRDSNGDPIEDALFGFDVQVTGRASPNFFGGLWAPENFWDGRAGEVFVDPVSGLEEISSGGALENQAIGPILSDVEMAKQGRTWAEVIAKLEAATPMLYAAELPQDMSDAIAAFPTYPALFADAFGDAVITPTRIAFAIATYERTLVADQTPWDDFMAGDDAAMTQNQVQGWNAFLASNCNQCHAAPLFTNDSFRTIGVRPVAEDLGRAEVTGDPADNAAFKVPTLRNVGLKAAFMHNGGFTTLADVVTFYQPGNPFPGNLDPLLPSRVPPNQQMALVDFLQNGLTDPRVEAATFPFDRPTLLVPVMASPALSGLLSAALLAGLRALRRGVRS